LSQTSDAWNDWGAVQVMQAKDFRCGEECFRRALAINSANAQAAANLGSLLASLGRFPEAIPFLESSLTGLDSGQFSAVVQLIQACQDERGRRRSSSVISADRLREKVAQIKWYHRIDLGDGIITPGSPHFSHDLDCLRIPERLDGETVLDVGAWDGGFSFAAERRGAKLVLATDGFVWRNKLPGASKAGFELARAALNSRVLSTTADLMELSPERTGIFDVVFLFETIYALRDPIATLERAFSLTRKLLILSTDISLPAIGTPALAFLPHNEFCEGSSTWWLPNSSAVHAMLKLVGFSRSEIVSEEAFDAPAGNGRGRVVIHAYR
jgi:tRNA (mo5U34)-methyltransferase